MIVVNRTSKDKFRWNINDNTTTFKIANSIMLCTKSSLFFLSVLPQYVHWPSENNVTFLYNVSNCVSQGTISKTLTPSKIWGLLKFNFLQSVSCNIWVRNLACDFKCTRFAVSFPHKHLISRTTMKQDCFLQKEARVRQQCFCYRG